MFVDVCFNVLACSTQEESLTAPRGFAGKELHSASGGSFGNDFDVKLQFKL